MMQMPEYTYQNTNSNICIKSNTYFWMIFQFPAPHILTVVSPPIILLAYIVSWKVQSAPPNSPWAPQHWWAAHTCHTDHHGLLGSCSEGRRPLRSGQPGSADSSHSAAAPLCLPPGTHACGVARKYLGRSWKYNRGTRWLRDSSGVVSVMQEKDFSLLPPQVISCQLTQNTELFPVHVMDFPEIIHVKTSNIYEALKNPIVLLRILSLTLWDLFLISN